MAITQTITALPTPAPSRTTQTADEFVSAMDNLLAAMPVMVTQENTWAGQANSTATTVNTDATTATTQAGIAGTKAAEAAASATAAAAAANAVAWISGNTYTAGQCVYSTVDFQSYRHITATSSLTTDPVADTINWVLIFAPPLSKLHAIALYF